MSLTMAQEHFKEAFLRMKDFRERSKFCDITLIVQEQKFHLHKIILAACSEYFRRMFITDMQERQKREIEISGVTIQAFSVCMEMVYFGSTDFTKTDVNTEEMLNALCLLQLWDFKGQFIDHLIKQLNAENCMELYKLSLKYDCKKLETPAEDLIVAKAELILKDESKLDEMDAEILTLILESEDVCVENECVLFDGLENWTSRNEEQRKQYFCQLLHFIRLPVIPRKLFTGRVLQNNHMQNECQECKRYLNQSISYLLDGEMHELKRYQINCRYSSNYTEEFLMVLDNNKTIQKFSIKNKTFTKVKIQEIPIETTSDGITIKNNVIYVMDENNGTHTFQCDFKNNGMWQDLPSLPTKHNTGLNSSSVVCYKNYILVIGGKIANTCISRVDCYDIINKKWIDSFPTLLEGRRYFASITHKESVYVIGGFGSALLSSVEMYSPKSNSWIQKPRLNHGRQVPSAAVFKHKIYVLGGQSTNERISSVETYHEGDAAWSIVSQLNVARDTPSCFVYDSKLFVFGGYRNADTSLFEYWCEESNKWVESDMKNEEINYCKLLPITK